MGAPGQLRVTQPPRTAGHGVGAGELGISEITVKTHRGKVMRKMKADSLADLVNMAARLRLAPDGPGRTLRVPT